MNFAKVWKRQLRLPVFIAGACVFVVTAAVLMRRHGLFQRIELRVSDSMLGWHLQPREYSAANDIVVIGIDEADLKALNHYPLTDDDKARLLEELATTYQPAAIGLDIFLDRPVGGNPAATQRLRRVLGKHSNIVAGYLVGSGTVEEPEISQPTMIRADGTERLMTGRRIGCIDQSLDRDGISRVSPLYLFDTASPNSQRAASAPSLSVGVANQFLEATGVLRRPDARRPEDLADPTHLNSFWTKRVRGFHSNDGGYADRDGAESSHTTALTSDFHFLVEYRGKRRYTTLRLRQVMPSLFEPGALEKLPKHSQLSPLKDPGALKGKVVLVGMTATSIKDYIITPVHPNFESASFGVYQHAVLADQLIRTARDGSAPPGVWSEDASWAWAALWTILGAGLGLTARIGFSTRAPWRLLFLAVAGQVVLIAITTLAFHRGLWIQLAPSSFCFILALAIVGAYVSQLARADRNTLNSIFVRICQKEVANELWKRRDELLDNGRLRPRKLTATLMFGDLKGFSTACEGLDPAQVIEWVNQYHQTMTSIVTRYHGVIVRYMGDGMMAVFGAPSASQDERQFPINARDAVNCALQMRRELADLHDTWRARGLPCLAMRVGIHTGIVVEGSVGSASRFEYVTLGDTTNTASRLETHDKTLMDPDVAAGGCRILIGEPTFQFVREQVQVRYIGEIPLDGKKNMLKVYGVTGPVEPEPPSSLE